MTLIIGAIIGLVGYSLGWRHAHQTIATECKLLGGFYVGGTVYTCVAKQDTSETAEESKA